MKFFKLTIGIFIFLLFANCDDANDLLNQHIENGPIIYAAKIDSLVTQSGFNRFRVNVYPAEDVNRSYCLLSWNITENKKDSVRIDYIDEFYDATLGCYYHIVNIPSETEIQGNLSITAQNVDEFGNKSLVEIGSAYVYGPEYTSSLVNAPVSVNPEITEITFEERIGMVGNVITYEKNNGEFTDEIYTKELTFPLVDAKRGGIIRTKTRYLINKSDIDTLEVSEFLETEIPTNDGISIMKDLSETSPILLDEFRLNVFNRIEEMSDEFNNPELFKDYLNSSEETAVSLENTTPLLYCYRYAFDKVIDELENTNVQNGSVAIWLLYNMGFIVKTPSGAFGVDIDHRLAEELAPLLDFICVSHSHVDHANKKLMDAMNDLGKPVLSNFYKEDSEYFSKDPSTYTIGDFTIQTDITDHLRDPELPDFVTVFRIECGDDAGNFSMLHCGDSGFNPIHFTNVEGPVDLTVMRWGAERENDILGSGSGQVQTEYAFLSHLIEQRHSLYPKGQASISKTLEHLPNVKCDQTFIPFWGEKIVWQNGQMN